jgi:hypothetical protein
MLDTNLTIEQIQSRLAHIDQFNLRRNVVVPNVSFGLLEYEADFVSMSKSGYLTEVEIKRSWEDFRKDFKKKHMHDDPRIAYFYYCVPKSIAYRVMDALYFVEPANTIRKYRITGIKEGVPTNAGLITYDNHDWQGNKCKWIDIDFMAIAGRRKAARKLTDQEQLKLAHLGCMRLWDLKKKISKLQEYDLFNSQNNKSLNHDKARSF